MDIPLQFHEFQHLNHSERCMKYSEVLQRSEMTLSDIDDLFTDLETLQGASNIRLRRLEDEMKILTEWCDKKDRSKGDIDLEFINIVSSGKRARQGKPSASIFTCTTLINPHKCGWICNFKRDISSYLVIAQATSRYCNEFGCQC